MSRGQELKFKTHKLGKAGEEGEEEVVEIRKSREDTYVHERSSSRRFGYFSEPDVIGKSVLIQLVSTFMQQDKSKDTRDLVIPVVPSPFRPLRVMTLF